MRRTRPTLGSDASGPFKTSCAQPASNFGSVSYVGHVRRVAVGRVRRVLSRCARSNGSDRCNSTGASDGLQPASDACVRRSTRSTSSLVRVRSATSVRRPTVGASDADVSVRRVPAETARKPAKTTRLAPTRETGVRRVALGASDAPAPATSRHLHASDAAPCVGRYCPERPTLETPRFQAAFRRNLFHLCKYANTTKCTTSSAVC